MRFPLGLACAVFTATTGLSQVASSSSWSPRVIGDTPPMWMEYRASVNDSGVLAGTIVVDTSIRPVVSVESTTTALETPAFVGVSSASSLENGAALDISSDNRVVGFRSLAANATRQASLWQGTAGVWSHRDLHEAVMLSNSGYAVSAAYGISPPDGSMHYVAGYAREKVGPSTLSKPVLWTVTAGAAGTFMLPLPTSAETPTSHAYGIAYGVSGTDRSMKRYACGGVGYGGQTGSSFMQAHCWDVTNPAAAASVLTPASLTSASGVATSVVNRVRVINFGSSSTGEWLSPQAVAVGTVTYTNGGSSGFVWNLTTGAFDINTALAASYDSILADVTRQSFTTSSAHVNATTGAIYHGARVVGAGANASGRLAAGTSANAPVPSIRAISQTRIAAERADAASTQTCNLDAQDDFSGLTFEIATGISQNGLHMAGAAGGKLVHMQNHHLGASILLRRRSAAVYSSATTSTSVTYHWVEVDGEPNAQVVWSNTAGCDALTSGLVCHGLLSGTFEVQKTRHSGLTSPSAYIQAVRSTGTCGITPVYAVTQLAATTNPSDNSLTAPGVVEDWRACGAVPAGRGGVTTGSNVDVQRDYYHCGACNASVGAHTAGTCTMARCNNGVREAKTTGTGCWIGGTETWSSASFGTGACYANGQMNPSSTRSYNLVATRSDSCGSSVTSVSYRNPCVACNQSTPTAWTTIASSLCCSSGAPRLDVYDRNQIHGCSDSTMSFDRNDGRVRGARWKDPRSGWVYTQADDWSSADGTCYAAGSGSPHTISDPGTVNDGYARPRRIDAFFTWPIDMEDWYEASFDDDGDGQPTPKPRARLISRNVYPGSSRRVRMKLCLYVDAANGNRNQVDIKDMRANAGVNKTSTHDGLENTPAYDAKGQCVETNDQGVADIVVYDYDNKANNKEDAYVHFVVSPLDDIEELHCDQTSYTLYYGNDKRAGVAPPNGYNAGRTGCLDCCN